LEGEGSTRGCISDVPATDEDGLACHCGDHLGDGGWARSKSGDLVAKDLSARADSVLCLRYGGERKQKEEDELFHRILYHEVVERA